MASLLAEKSAVITTVEAAVPVLQNNISAMGFNDHIPVVEAANIGVAELDTDKGKALQKFNATAESIQFTAQINTVILGCASADQISSDFALTAGFTAIEPVSVAARSCRGISARLQAPHPAQNFLSAVKAEQNSTRLVLPYGLKRLRNSNLS